MPPTTNTTGCSSGSAATYSGSFVSLPCTESEIFRQPMGRCAVIGFLMTLRSVGPCAARMLILCRRWVMSPEKRLNVRGSRVCGLTSMRTFLAVWMKIWSLPALLRGESRSIRRHWCVISGRASWSSIPCLTQYCR
eukprot:Amastigsp_a339768_1633.p2 type:complete len:136 gc:universal Amastigsp_a339768_1633:593-186(-)